MPNYNIYIHNDETSESHPTRPQTDSKSETKADGVNYGEMIKKGANYLSNPDSLVSAGVDFMRKMIPSVACATAVIGFATKTLNTITSFVSIESGDYRFSKELNDFGATTRAIFTPYSTGINAYKQMQQVRLSNNRLQQYRELTGDAIINSYGKGV